MSMRAGTCICRVISDTVWWYGPIKCSAAFFGVHPAAMLIVWPQCLHRQAKCSSECLLGPALPRCTAVPMQSRLHGGARLWSTHSCPGRIPGLERGVWSHTTRLTCGCRPPATFSCSLVAGLLLGGVVWVVVGILAVLLGAGQQAKGERGGGMTTRCGVKSFPDESG